MDTQAIAEACLFALEDGDLDTVAGYLADDFQFSSHTGPPLGKQQWLGMSRALRQAFPDFSYNFQIHHVDGNRLDVSVAFTGTHTGDLDLSRMGMGVISATGQRISTPRTESEGVVADGLIQSIHSHDSPDSGIPALLAQIGVHMG